MSTPTPSLRRRVIRSGLLAVAVLEAIVLVAVFLAVKLQLDASRASDVEITRTLTVLAITELAGFVLTLLLGAIVLRRTTESAMAPLSAVVAAADRTAAGDRGHRIVPDDPTTELGRLAGSFDAMVAALEEAVADARASDERSQRFLQDAAHQLRTPIATIRASVELIMRVDDPAERDQLLVGIVRETARSSRLLSALLRVARLDRGEPPARVETDLAGLCVDEVERARSLSPGLDIRCETRGDLPRVDLHAADVREALANLLDNARRHATSRITVTVGRHGTSVLVRVEDDGPGIAPDRAETVFERFSSDAPGGSGLGLPIARGIAEAHGGGLVYRDGGFDLTLAVGSGTGTTPA